MLMHSTGLGAGWIIFLVALWILLAGSATWVTISLISRPRPHPATLPSPLDILERRFAAGKMTRDDFDEARARLRTHDLDR
ncbi:hypothetical protein [Kribbella sp. NBC_00889]|uniref:hypothetical protein n=1 Tax=Kribbella sp. NBC_00889 TaxID=2975974 RepID=UPI00386BF586|nr:hypothetical protein OG817_12340 [Kribbella sp. NBC_00889]